MKSMTYLPWMRHGFLNKKMDVAALRLFLRSTASMTFQGDIDSPVQQLNMDIAAELDCFIPLQNWTLWQDKPCDKWLSATAFSTKKEKRRLEKWYLHHRMPVNRQTYRQASSVGKMIKNCAPHTIATKLWKLLTTHISWKMVSHLLHLRSDSVWHKDLDTAAFTSEFCNFLVNKCIMWNQKWNQIYEEAWCFQPSSAPWQRRNEPVSKCLQDWSSYFTFKQTWSWYRALQSEQLRGEVMQVKANHCYCTIFIENV